jgi:hypothetical protein
MTAKVSRYIIGISLFLLGYGVSAAMHRVAAQGSLGDPIAPAIVALLAFIAGSFFIYKLDKEQSKTIS